MTGPDNICGRPLWVDGGLLNPPLWRRQRNALHHQNLPRLPFLIHGDKESQQVCAVGQVPRGALQRSCHAEREHPQHHTGLLKDTKQISFQIQEIESPALLDPESAYEEIKQTLERLEKSIEQVSSSKFFFFFIHNAFRFGKKLSSLRSMRRSLNFQPTSIQRLMR